MSDDVDQAAPEDSDRLTGPADPHSVGPDAPTAPGGPQRSDSPAGATTPGGEAEPGTHGSEHAEHATSTSDQPSIPVPASRRDPTADGEIHAGSQADLVNEQMQEQNAETSLDQPSDGSGGE